MLPENIHELHLIDGFDITKTPSESYAIEVDFGPTEREPGLIDVPNGEYIDALRSSVAAYARLGFHVLEEVNVTPGSIVQLRVNNKFRSYKVSGSKVQLVSIEESDLVPEPVIDYGTVSFVEAKASFKLAGKSQEHPDWGGIPGMTYFVVFKIVTNWDNVYWRVGIIRVNQEA